MEISSWMYVLVILAVFSLSIVAMKAYCITKINKEGFAQEGEYMIKRDNDAYDSFYYYNYDVVQKTDDRLQFDVLQFMKTNPSVKSSQILDVGFGTGNFLNELQQQYNFKVCGLDLSEDFVSETKKRYPALTLKRGDALDITNFNKEVFTHVTCLHFTLYEMEDKTTFLKNVYYWLKEGGELIVHVVCVEKFSMISPGANMREELVEEFSGNRITSTIVSYPDFIYSMKYLCDEDKWIVQETFKDRTCSKKRENERVFYPISEINLVQLAEMIGFTVKNIVSYKKINGDNNQWLFVLMK
jgi:ubiquinone/menaquinone biosynthesis C-methylase UbiE